METVNDTIGGMLDKIAEKYPGRDALIHSEKSVRYTYQLLEWQVNRAGGGLLALGINPGDRVAIWAENLPEWIVAMLGIIKIGAVFVPVDPGAKDEDAAYILNQAECVGLVATKSLVERAGALEVPSIKHIIAMEPGAEAGAMPWNKLMNMGDAQNSGSLRRAANAVRPKDCVAIMYTSGTTGKPKGVMLDHSGLINKSLCSTKRQKITEKDRLCLFFPLFHMFGNTCIALSGLIRGASLIIPADGFDPVRILSAIHDEDCSAVYGSPAMLIGLLDHPNFQMENWQQVRTGIVGGAPCPMELMKRLVEEIGITDLTVGYGITETASWITMTHPDDPLSLRVGTIGTPLPCSEVKIVDSRTGADLETGRQGELCTRGFLMMEYYKMPGATAAAIDREGWFHTGDLGEMDERGYVKITGRLKDVIVRNHAEIYPVEVEEALYQHPRVAEVQVFGIGHAKKGQEVAAWVRIKEGAEITQKDLSDFARAHLAPEIFPDHFKIVHEFPMTRSGKVRKYLMAEQAAREVEG